MVSETDSDSTSFHSKKEKKILECNAYSMCDFNVVVLIFEAPMTSKMLLCLSVTFVEPSTFIEHAI